MTTLGTRVRFASYLLQSLENKFNKTDRLSPYSQNSSYYHWRKYKSLITLEPTSILLECVPVAPNSYRQRSLHLLDNLKIQIFTFIKTSNKYSKILVFKCSVNVLFSFIINYIFHFIHTYIYIYSYSYHPKGEPAGCWKTYWECDENFSFEISACRTWKEKKQALTAIGDKIGCNTSL